MDDVVPRVMLRARREAEADGGHSLLEALRTLETEHPELGWLSLWKLASTDEEPVLARTLSFAIARHGIPNIAAEAVGLWLLARWLGEDLSTLVNLLTALEGSLESESGIPLTWRGSLAPFLHHCLANHESNVRHSVLDMLDAARSTNFLGQFLDRDSGKKLAEHLAAALAPSAEEEERDLLEEMCGDLRGDALPTASPREPEALKRLALDVEAAATSLSGLLGDVHGLIEVAYERALLEGVAVGTSAPKKPDFAKLASLTKLKDRYKKQLDRVRGLKQQVDCIEETVDGVMAQLLKASVGSLVIYGDPQSGKTEMMICLTARLLDEGHRTIVHLLNDSVDLLAQSLDRFRLAGLAPAPRNASDLAQSPLAPGHEAVLFCKKNAKDLDKLIKALKTAGPVVVIDDEADYATPNAKVNENLKTKINSLVSKLLGKDGIYIGVTATPARLNLNNTFNNRTETWVQFRPHAAYTGQDVFFPQIGMPAYRLTPLGGPGTPTDARDALARFLVTVAFLNTTRAEDDYSFLVHTSGKTDDHKADRKTIEASMRALVDGVGPDFEAMVGIVHAEAQRLYPGADPDVLTAYVIANASRSSFVVLNSKRDRATAGDSPTVPTCPFTVIIGGNIVSRGVTFPNLLSMFFTRSVKNKLQQDTYIQRARMFGARGSYLEHFELTIPGQLYEDWHRCFVFHRLALQAIKNNKVSPVWVGDKRISIAASSSIDRATVDLDKGEMSFQMFPWTDFAALDAIVEAAPTDVQTLKQLRDRIGGALPNFRDALPNFLVEYLEAALIQRPGSLAIHTSSSIANYGASADVKKISREKGFIGKPQLEEKRFPGARHHVKILHNGKMARVFYKNLGGVQFVQNLKK